MKRKRQTCAQLVEPGLLRVVACSHGVEVVSLHNQHVRLHHLRGHRVSEDGVVLVQVCAADRDGSVIYGKDAFRRDPDRADAQAARLALEDVRLAVPTAICSMLYRRKEKETDIIITYFSANTSMTSKQRT